MSDDNDCDNLKINESFAKSYNRYRQKEELQRLKDKYGQQEPSSSESESEDEEANEITLSLEKDFFKTLSYLKKDDPAIYDKNRKFFQDDYKQEEEKEMMKGESKPMFMKDYERKVITEKEGKFVEDDESDEEPHDIGYYEQQRKLKDELREAIEENESDDAGEILVKKSRERVIGMPSRDFKSWLGGEQESTSNEDEDVTEMKSLKEYWSDKKLDDGEKFLRDYFLKKKYIDPKDDDANVDIDIPTGSFLQEESEEEEEGFDQVQEKFEHKYNFRFEEPDQEFIKSYPRTVQGSVRRKDDSRKMKREMLKIKEEEKNRKKKEELNELKRLKRQEIMDKISRLRETTGNGDISFKDADIEEEFNPEKYDDRMKELFNEEFYEEDGDDEKPVFSDMEEDNMCEYDPQWSQYAEEEYYEDENDTAAEDPDFNMDCDYNPEEHKKVKEKKMMKNPTKDDKKKRKKSAFFESVAKEKPVFDPADKTFEEYLDEYYSLDYEDLIGDLPCRFKYRKVMSNNFGLTTDEILHAKDSELNAWCSLKKAVQYRTQDEEQQDKVKYSIKGRNMKKKANILRSVYKTEEDKKTSSQEEEIDKSKLSKAQKRRLRKKQKTKQMQQSVKISSLNEVEEAEEDSSAIEEDENDKINKNEEINEEKDVKTQSAMKHKKKQAKKRKANSGNEQFQKVSKIPSTRLEAYGLNPKKFLNKVKYAKT